MSKIEWCDKTINPIIGCTKVSPACDNCYAEVMAVRLQSMGTRGYDKVITEKEWSGRISFVRSELDKPYKWKKPQRIFVGSMTDLFHDNVPSNWIDLIIDMVLDNPHHTFLFLTKREQRMRRYFLGLYNMIDTSKHCLEHKSKLRNGVISNLWLGVTVESQKYANKRIPILLETPASRHFISVEPMLEKITLCGLDAHDDKLQYFNSLSSQQKHHNGILKDFDNKTIDWVICGGESGRNARPMHPEWVKNLKRECGQYDVPFFFKQWGEWIYNDFGNEFLPDRVGRKRAGKLIDGKLYQEFPKKAQ